MMFKTGTKDGEPLLNKGATERSVSELNGLLVGVITKDEKRILQKNVDEYLELDCIFSHASLNIINKLLKAC